MSALDRLSKATTVLRGVTNDVVDGYVDERRLGGVTAHYLRGAVRACVDEPVFREALVATWKAAQDFALEQEASAGVPTHPKCLQHGRCVEAISCLKGKCLLTESKLRQAVSPPVPKRLTREQVDRIFDAHAEAPTLEFRYLLAEAIQRAGDPK